MDAQKLDFPDDYFDYVITTFVWCSVPEPILGLQEAKRVLKSSGQGIFLEHVLSQNKFIALWQHFHNPLTQFLFGFNVNRHTLKNIEQAGFKVLKDKKMKLMDIFRLFITKK